MPRSTQRSKSRPPVPRPAGRVGLGRQQPADCPAACPRVERSAREQQPHRGHRQLRDLQDGSATRSIAPAAFVARRSRSRSTASRGPSPMAHRCSNPGAGAFGAGIAGKSAAGFDDARGDVFQSPVRRFLLADVPPEVEPTLLEQLGMDGRRLADLDCWPCCAGGGVLRSAPSCQPAVRRARPRLQASWAAAPAGSAGRPDRRPGGTPGPGRPGRAGRPPGGRR